MLFSAEKWAMAMPVRTITVMWLAACALAAAADPGETAVDFLEKVRAGAVNLEPGGDTAISAQTSASKRREIARRLDRMARDLGSDPLEAGAVRIDGELAAVLVRKIGGFDPGRMQVFPVALIKRGEAWAAAPVPASFENTGYGYGTALRQRSAALQNWMLREQVLDLALLRDQSVDRMRRKIEASLPGGTLRGLGSKQTGERFLSACARQDLPEILGLLGGLASPLPDDWSLRIKAAETAVSTAGAKRPWRLLMSKEVLRALVHHEEDENQALVSIACLDSTGGSPQPGSPRIELVHLELSKSAGGLWRIDPPEYFLHPSVENEQALDEIIDAELLDAFPTKLAELHPPLPEDSAQAASERLIGHLQSDGLAQLLRLIRPAEEGESARESLLSATRLWRTIREPGGGRHIVPLALHTEDGKAVAIWHLFAARSPDRLDLRTVYFEKSPQGWFWVPRPREESEAVLRDWTDQQAQHWQQNWQAELFLESPELEILPQAGAPTEEQARATVDAWHKAIDSSDVTTALRLTAFLKKPDSKITVLRNLGYEITGSPRNSKPSIITGVHRGEIWTAVGVRTFPDGKPAHPLYPVVSTPAGPRILIEVDLFASENRSRDFLNKTALDRLSHLPPAAATELRQLLADHQSTIGKGGDP